jgi:solute carrier family 44 protein 1 (choline transporter-like protein)
MKASEKNTREALKDKNYDGQDYQADPELRNGPLVNRKCTDFLFWAIFVAALVFYGISVRYGYANGKPKQLFTPVDGDGKFCGLDENVDYPYLYYIITAAEMKLPKAVCVKACPAEIITPIECKTTSRMKDASICTNELSSAKKGHVGYGTNRVLKRFCIPDIDKLPSNFDDTLNNVVGEFGLDDVQEYMEDIDDAANLYIYTFITCVIITIIYSVLIYYFTGLVVWASIISTGLGLVFLSVWLQNYHNTKYGTDNKLAIADDKNENAGKNNTGTYIQVGVYVLYGICAFYFIALCCMFKDIAISVGVLKTSALIVIRNIRMLFIPFFSAIILVIWASFWLSSFSYLISSGTITQPKAGSQLKRIELSENQKYLMWF